MNTFRLILRRTRTLFWTALSILIIAAAAVVGTGKLLMPYSQHYQPELEAWLSAEFGQEVRLESFTGDWEAFGPRLALRGLTFSGRGAAAGEVAISEAALDLKPMNAFLPGRALYQFLVIGADFQLVRTREGAFELSGLGVSGWSADSSNSTLRNLKGIGELVLEDSSLEYVDERNGVSLKLADIDARVQLDDAAISLQLQASFTEPADDQVFGDVEATALLRLGDSAGLAEARWQLSLGDLALASIHGRVPQVSLLPREGWVNARLWGEWSPGQPVGVRGVVDLRNGLLEQGQHSIVLRRVNSRLAWTLTGADDWRLDFSDLQVDDGEQSWAVPSLAVARDTSKDLGLWVSADFLPVAPSARMARKLYVMSGKDWPDHWPGSAEGRLTDFSLVMDAAWQVRQLSATGRQLGIAAFGRWPAVHGVDGEFQLASNTGTFRVQAHRLGIDWPGMFRQPLEFSLPPCSGELTRPAHWQLALQGCSAVNETLALNGDITMVLNGGRPAVDINLQFPRGRIGELGDYWPQRLLKPPVLGWLRRSLEDGEVTDGRLLIHGDLDDWPFRGGEGRLEGFARVERGAMTYLPAWPKVEDVTAAIRFIGTSLDIEGRIGATGGVAVNSVTARIPDLKAPLLTVEYQAAAGLDEMLAYVVRSPLQNTVGADLSGFELDGAAATSGLIAIPLGRVPGALSLAGDLLLEGNGFRDISSGISLASITGNVRYTHEDLVGAGLAGLYQDQPVTLSLAAGKKTEHRFRADMRGRFALEQLLPATAFASAQAARITGTTDWDVAVILPHSDGPQPAHLVLAVASDLAGIELDYPPPLKKSDWERWPLTAQVPLQGPHRVLELDVADRLRISLDLEQSEVEDAAGMLQQESAPVMPAAASAGIRRLLVQFEGGPAELPGPGLIRIGGRMPVLDLDGWIDIIRAEQGRGAGLGGLALEPLDLLADELRLLGRRFDEVAMHIAAERGDISVRFGARDIDGQVVFTPGSDSGNGSLSAEFNRLVLAKATSNAVEKQSDPASLPELHLYARSFRYGDVEMGATRIEAFPQANGFHFEKVEAESAALSLRATGDWTVTDGVTRSDFNIVITAESLGQLLTSMAINSALEGGQTVFHFDAWWPGSPAAFALARLNGEVDFSVSRGQISNAGAGTGRLLGLLSIQALPRRLALDFRDVFDTGFNFDEASGTFRMENGTAVTDDVVLSSSSARIQLSGSTNLVAQRYDQLMTIQPGVGNTLPVIGALAGGPGGAAAGLALQGLLHKQLGEATQFQYTITGSWDEPMIEPVVKSAIDG